jgi:SAM-dependent methyltransferase
MVASTLATIRQVGDEGLDAGRAEGQRAWYEFACQFVRGKTVLDVGCGLGYGLEILARSAERVHGHDVDPRLQTAANISIGGLEQFPDKSFDVVTCVEVIEHVEDDRELVLSLTRIARQAVFITTPNWTFSRCKWPFHLREYTPMELVELLLPYGQVRLFKGNGPGTIVYPVSHFCAYFIFNSLRVHPATAFATRVANKLLPVNMRLQGHNAALVYNLRTAIRS